MTFDVLNLKLHDMNLTVSLVKTFVIQSWAIPFLSFVVLSVSNVFTLLVFKFHVLTAVCAKLHSAFFSLQLNLANVSEVLP